MASPIVISVVGDTRDLVSGVGKAKGELSGLGRVASNAGRIVKGGLVLATAAAVAFGVKSVKAASDAQQSLGATETVFKRFADTVVDRSNHAATAVGLSANEYRELNNVLGASLKAAGTPLREVADLTDKLTTKAADLAATYGGTTREAIESVSSLLRGEADPIEKYGVSIKQSDVNARLAAQGLDKLTGSALKTADQQARLKLLFDQTKDSTGAFRREGDTLAHQQQVLAANIENVEAAVGELLLPMLTDLAQVANDKLVPALEDGVDWFKRNKDEIGDLASTVQDAVLPPLETLGGLAKDLAGFLADLPGPVQKFGIEAVIAAAAITKINNAIAGAKLTGFAANLRNAETRTAALSSAARTAAGAGGVLALTQSIGETNGKLKALESVAGGALLGFSLGGPWGAALGAGAGAGWALYDAFKSDHAIMQLAHQSAMDYAGALDEVTGALTKTGRAEIVQEARAKGINDIAAKTGINMRDLVGSINGNEGATRRLTKAYDENFQKLSGPEQIKFHEWLRANTNAMVDQRNKTLDTAGATKTWKEALKGLPPKVATEVKAIGTDITRRELAKLKKQYDLSPKQVKTIVDAVGTEATIKKVKGVWTVMEAGKEVRPGTNKWLESLVDDLNRGKKQGKAGNELVNQYLHNVGNVKPNMDPLLTGLTNGIATARSRASSGGSGIGSALSSGFEVGLDFGGMANAVASAINQAIAAGRRAADAHSPSRKTKRLGKDLTDGLIAGLRGGTRGVKSAIGDLVGEVAKAWNKHHKEKFSKAQRAGLGKAFADERKDLTKLAGRYRVVTAALGKAGDQLKRLREERAQYVASVVEGARATATVTGAGLLEDGTQTAAGIRADLQARLDAIRNFNAKIQTLIGLGLKGDALRQIVDAGVDAGTVTAEALLAGGKDAVADVVDLQRQIKTAAGALGETAGAELFDAGIAGAQSLVRGLERDKKALDAAAGRIADRLLRTIRSRLGLSVALGGNGGRHRRALDHDVATTGRRNRVNAGATKAGMASTITVRLTSEQRSQLERGRELRIDLDAYEAAGGRTRA